MERVRAAQRDSGMAVDPASFGSRSTRGRAWAEPVIAAAAAAAVVTAILWGKIDRQQREISGLANELARQHARVDELQANMDQDRGTIHLFASPAVQMVTLEGASDQLAAKGRVFWDKDRDAFHLYASGLRPLPAGKAYQLWFISAEQKKIPAGTFSVNPRGEASLVATAPSHAGRIAALAVTDEPAGGSPQPTGQIRLIGKAG